MLYHKKVEDLMRKIKLTIDEHDYPEDEALSECDVDEPEQEEGRLT